MARKLPCDLTTAPPAIQPASLLTDCSIARRPGVHSVVSDEARPIGPGCERSEGGPEGDKTDLLQRQQNRRGSPPLCPPLSQGDAVRIGVDHGHYPEPTVREKLLEKAEGLGGEETDYKC